MVSLFRTAENMNQSKFIEQIASSYQFKGDSIILGGALLEGESIENLKINIPIKTLNRHGLIAGATGTGKTKTLQIIIERLSDNSIPVLCMDIKGDLSGLARPGISNEKIEERQQKIGEPYIPTQYPVELFTISDKKGVRLRSTLLEFGPILFSKILELNDTQSGIVSVIYKFCDDRELPLIDLKDFKKVLSFISEEGKNEFETEYGKISSASIGTILRKIIELEQQGADKFFGELSFDPDDLMRINENGLGYINILKLDDLQDKPKLFSTYMLSLLAEVYSTFPEEGDVDKPKLVIFIDEAHLIFKDASKTLLDQIETIIKLIRSKGVGIFFCTQNPTDIPKAILSQLGLKIQHALRAFTANDRKMIKLTSENYPISEFYKTEELITSLGIGQAIVTALNEKGIPTPLVSTLLCAPKSRMDILTENEIDEINNSSKLVKKYSVSLDKESAYEILLKKIETPTYQQTDQSSRQSGKQGEKSTVESILNNPLTRQVGRTVAREVTRGLLGILGISGTTKRKRSLF
jgi:DNA helicase HerA-like ATPase